MFDLDYAFRIKTYSVFEQSNPEMIFEVFVFPSDKKLQEFNVYENIWRETLLLQSLRDEVKQVT